MPISTIIEIFCIVCILFLQWKSYSATKQTIDELKTIVPPQEKCRIEKVTREVPTEERFYYLDKYFARYIGFNLIRDYLKNDLNVQQGGVVDFELMMAYPMLSDEQKDFYIKNRRAIDLEAQRNPPMKKEEFFRLEYSEKNETTDSLNKYLEKNKGAVADFSLLRDITQRNVDVVEDEINLTVQSPLFLGLAGTMLGIIIGVLSLINSDTKTLLEDGGINTLLVSVMIAMIASLAGLILTTYNSSINFKGVKVDVEHSKNRFFTFLQTELIPVLSENVTTGIIGLNRNIEKFGDSFKKDVDKLEGIINKNHESLLAQQQSIEALNNTNLRKIIGFNLDVFKELRESMSALEKLSYSLKNVDNLVANSKEIVQRTQDVGNISIRISQLIEQSNDLQIFLKSHFKELSDRGQVINDTVGKVDDTIGKSLNELRIHTEERIQAVKNIQLKEEDLLLSQFSNKREFEGKIKSIETYIEEFKKFAAEESKNQKNILEALKSNNAFLNTLVQQNKSNKQPHQGSIRPQQGDVGMGKINNGVGDDKVDPTTKKPESISEPVTKELKIKIERERTVKEDTLLLKIRKWVNSITSFYKRTPKDTLTKNRVIEVKNQAPDDQLINLD